MSLNQLHTTFNPNTLTLHTYLTQPRHHTSPSPHISSTYFTLTLNYVSQSTTHHLQPNTFNPTNISYSTTSSYFILTSHIFNTLHLHHSTTSLNHLHTTLIHHILLNLNHVYTSPPLPQLKYLQCTSSPTPQLTYFQRTSSPTPQLTYL